MPNLSQIVTQLQAQRKQTRHQLKRLDEAIAAVQNVGRRGGKRRAKRKISMAGRRRIAAAQRARWAKFKRNKAS